MNREYLILQKELELAELECINESTLYNELYGSYITESEKVGSSNFVTRTFEAVREFIKKIKDKLVSFFTKSRKDEINKKIALIEKNKNLKNKKVEIVDYDKLEKLQDYTIGKIEKANDSSSIQKIMDYYKKNKTLILGTTIFVTIGALAYGTKKHIDGMTEKIISLNNESHNWEQKYRDMSKNKELLELKNKELLELKNKEASELKNKLEISQERFKNFKKEQKELFLKRSGAVSSMSDASMLAFTNISTLLRDKANTLSERILKEIYNMERMMSVSYSKYLDYEEVNAKIIKQPLQ